MNIQHIHGVPPLYTNTFLIITNAKHGILIDAAAEPGVYLKALDEAGATLTHILLTHGHYDHVGAVAALKKGDGLQGLYGPVDAQGSQLLPLTPDVLTDNWPANDELTIDELTFKNLPHARPHRGGGSACPATGCCSAVTRCLQVPAGGRISPAAACRRWQKACPCWQSCRCPMQQKSCPDMRGFSTLGQERSTNRP